MSESVLNVIHKSSVSEDSSIKMDTRINDYLIKLLGEENTSGLLWDVHKHESDIPPTLYEYTGMVNIQRVNDIKRINKYLEAVNRNLINDQYLVISLETMASRRKRLLNKYPKGFNRVYYFMDFILKRVLPKWKPTRKIYFRITNGRNRVISLTEGLGRIICCGFEIVGFKQIHYNTYIVGKKVKAPAYDLQPTYGALIRLRRIGEDGKVFNVFKLRTMYPFSEYLQDYIFEQHDLSEGGKFRDDFRMTSWGQHLRRYWIDELPMFINWFRGEMKLVGVRPLSRQYFELYPEDLRKMRIKVKPGLVPPYYADMPDGFNEIIDSERRYLEAYEQHPIRTDIRYLLKAIMNIIFRGARSN